MNNYCVVGPLKTKSRRGCEIFWYELTGQLKGLRVVKIEFLGVLVPGWRQPSSPSSSTAGPCTTTSAEMPAEKSFCCAGQINSEFL